MAKLEEHLKKIDRAIGAIKAEIQMRKQVFHNQEFRRRAKVLEMQMVLEVLEEYKLKETPVKLFDI